ncbi:hypothetical protein G6514_009815 [Epicoccum nigrum]|nr:hypothetical protein G6514_009815 [Epicoccum nigrum]
MLLIQPRKRNRATFDQDQNHATSHPASWQSRPKDISDKFQDVSIAVSSASSTVGADNVSLSRTSIAALDLEELLNLSAHISERIQIKKRYNDTPLRRILARQAPDHQTSRNPVKPEEDTFSQTDTLINTEVEGAKISRESPGVIQRRYNNTPLRRILSRQTVSRPTTDGYCSTHRSRGYDSESPETRKARYNNTPLRRILSHQTSAKHSIETYASPPASTPRSTESPLVPRSNTPLRRILARQTSIVSDTPNEEKEQDAASNRADSVISSNSPILSFPSLGSSSKSLWGNENSLSSLILAPPYVHLNAETDIRAYEERIWAKSKQGMTPLFGGKHESKRATTVTVTEVGVGNETRVSNRVVVDDKGSPLRRILQRQASSDWRVGRRLGVV